MSLGEVVHLVLAGIEAPCRHFMQQRLPKMRPSMLHQCDARTPTPAETVADPSDELEPRRTSAHYDDPVQNLGAKTAVQLGRCHRIPVGRRLAGATDGHIEVGIVEHPIAVRNASSAAHSWNV